MASSVIGDRLKKIDGLKSFTKSVEERVKAIANELNWNHEEFSENKTETTLATCSVHPEHKVGNLRIKEHEANCQWRKDGYHRDDVPFPEFSGQGSYVLFTPELQESVIKNACSEKSNLLGETSAVSTLQRGIPQTSSRFDENFSREEKLALYDYVVANTEKQKVYKDIAVLPGKEEKSEEKLMTPLEIAAAERDSKRRRASYRNKVHTNRKTQTEILREVIESQMEALTEEISVEKNSKEKYPNRDERYRDMSYSQKPHQSYRSYKSSESRRDHGKSYSHRGTKYNDRYSRDERRSKSRKRKRSRSRSKSWDKYKKSHIHHSHSSSSRYHF